MTRTATRPEVAGAEVAVTSNGLLRTRTDPTGATWTYLYDALARPVGTVDPRTGTNHVAYFENGRIAYEENAAGNRTSYGYDPATGRRTSVTNALGQAVQSSFNARGQLTAVWGDAYPVTYEYDGYGRMVLMKTWKDGNGTPEETRWHFDEATGLLTNKVHADGLGPSHEYDARGRTTKRIWARGVETVYSHDALGQVTNVHYSDATPDWELAYDRQGRILHASNAFGTWSNSYGVLELLEERFPDGSVVVRSHDAFGRPSNLSVDSDYSVDYAFDPLGRLDSVSPGGGEPFHYDYLENSTTIAGWSLGSNAMQVVYSREPNRDIRTGVGTFWDGTPVWRSDDTFDAAGRKILQENGDGASSVTNAFAYNPRSELVSAQMGTNRYGYAYDSIGNRTAATNNASAVSYIANDLNQYTLVPEENRSFQYDSDGNLVSDGEWTYSWDAENRLVAASNASFAIAFEYDYLGRRIGKTVNGVRSSFVYDGWSLLRETTGTNATHYVWGADVSQRMQGAGDIGGLLCVRVGGTPYYPCADGNIVGYVDGTGATVARREYSPFGETMAEIGTAPAGLRIWFSSKYLDEETGLYYYGYRYYHPGLGRWLSRDPLEELDSGNLYAFVLNMPTFAVDLYGFSTEIECHKWNPADFAPTKGIEAHFGVLEIQLSWDFAVSGKMCNICCSDGSVEQNYSLDFDISGTLEIGAATWSGEVNLGELRGTAWFGITGGVGVTAAGGGSVEYDGCSGRCAQGRFCAEGRGWFNIAAGGNVEWKIGWWEQSFGAYGEFVGTGYIKKCVNVKLCKNSTTWDVEPHQWCISGEANLHINVSFSQYTWTFWKREYCFPKTKASAL